MKVIKLAIISVFVFAVIITLISLFFPSNVRISKAADITTNKDSLIKKIADPGEWQQWYPGADTMEVVRLMRKAVGLSLRDGKGLIRISGRTDSTVMAESTGPHIRNLKMGWNFYPAASPNKVTIQWYMDFHLRWYPWEKFSSIMLEKRYGPTMEQGLEKLKALLEK